MKERDRQREKEKEGEKKRKRELERERGKKQTTKTFERRRIFVSCLISEAHDKPP